MALSAKEKLARWRSLDFETQLELVRRLIERRGQEFRKLYANVLTVGVGYKQKQNKSDVVYRNRRYVCIRFVVDRKRKRIRGKPIPGSIDLYVELGGERLLASVPTDVDILGAGEPQSRLELGAGLISYPGGDVSQAAYQGSCMCMVRDRQNSSQHYLLGCNHVFCASLAHPHCLAIGGTTSFAGSTGAYLGSLYDYTALRPSQGYGMDAALVSLPQGLWDSLAFGGISPLGYANGLQLPPDCTIHTPRQRVSARFSDERYDIALPYGHCGYVRFQMLYKYTATTLQGDSGSPLIDSNGVLHGMHIWGDPANRIAYAIPAFLLLGGGLFFADIELVTG